jgi:serine/threonine-protein kinase RsbW
MSATQAPAAGGDPLSSKTERVELYLPVLAELRVLARMSASAIASRLDFGVDAVEDLRLAIDELCTSCAIGANEESRLLLEYAWDDDTIRVTCEVSPVQSVVASLDETLDLSARILDALVDAHGIEPVDGERRKGWLTKSRPARG